VTDPSPDRPPPVDDPTGGRALTRRLAVLLPAALAIGFVIGLPLAILAGDWRPALLVPLALAGLVGTLAAAVEDGRVQQRINRRYRGRERHGGEGTPPR
jgi:hypothetical protein